jgi:hypothetical protein
VCGARPTTPEAKALIELMDVSQLLSWPYTAPPGIPADRRLILQKAFMDTQQDPEYLAEAEKEKLELSPIGGEDLRKILVSLSDRLTPQLIDRYNAITAKTKSK